MKASPTSKEGRYLVDVAQELSTDVLATSLFVVKDTGGGGLKIM